VTHRDALSSQLYFSQIQRSTSVDFNCLDLVISVESWVVVIDFFSASPSSSARRTEVKVNVQANEDTQNGESGYWSASVRIKELSIQ
jgi:vacuolar protein sorting-associated protein 13D